MRVLQRGTTVTYQHHPYTIEQIHSIEPDRVLYEVSGLGYKKLLSQAEIQWDEEDVVFQDVVTLGLYKLDFETGIVNETPAYGIVVPASLKCNEERLLIYAPLFCGLRKKSKLSDVSRDYQLILTEPNLHKAHIILSDAVYEKFKKFEEKVSTYSELIEKMTA